MKLEDKYWAAGWFDSQKGKPHLEKKSPTRIAWSMEVSAFLNNDLLIFFRDNFGATVKKVKGDGANKGTLGEGYSLRLRFTKPALIRIIEELGPYLRQRREIYERISKEGKFTRLKGLPCNDPRCRQEVVMSPSQFDSKYQKDYAAGVLEGSCFPYFKAHIYPPEEICTTRNAKKQDVLNIYITISLIAKKYLEHENISHAFCNASTKNKFKVVKAKCIKKLLDNLLDHVRFRKDLEVMRSAVEWWSRPEKKFFKGQMLDNLKEKCKYYAIKINENHFDESLVKIGIDGKQQALYKKKKDEWVEREQVFEKESREVFKTIQKKIRIIKKIKRRFLTQEHSQFFEIREKEIKRCELNIEKEITHKALCRTCKLVKDKKEFTINKVNPSGVNFYCKSCIASEAYWRTPKCKERTKKYYEDHKEKIIKDSVRYKREVASKDPFYRLSRVKLGSGEEFWNDKDKVWEEYDAIIRRNVGTTALRFKVNRNEHLTHLEKEWANLPREIKEKAGLPNLLTAEEMYILREKGLIDIDHIIPKAKIKGLIKSGFAKGMTVYVNHSMNLRPLPKLFNIERSARYTLLYPHYSKKEVKRIFRAVFQKSLDKSSSKS